ncbi:hypothetical protein OCT63_01125 [Vibrio sp. RW]|nr:MULTISPECIES: hypothetical protein [Vibrio]MDA0142834.1 hypothetical protein [Vibrio sp. RW]
MESLSLAQAQKMVLLSQKLPPKKQRNGGALAIFRLTALGIA